MLHEEVKICYTSEKTPKSLGGTDWGRAGWAGRGCRWVKPRLEAAEAVCDDTSIGRCLRLLTWLLEQKEGSGGLRSELELQLGTVVRRLQRYDGEAPQAEAAAAEGGGGGGGGVAAAVVAAAAVREAAGRCAHLIAHRMSMISPAGEFKVRQPRLEDSNIPFPC
eukprot:SAG11_NODE_490_length_8982_cov_5.961162_2_plen_164_part_00